MLRFVISWACLVWFAAAPAALELDETPAEPSTWGYRPEGNVTAQNPPGFTWRPTPGAASYRLQVARDAAFQDIVYERSGVRWCAHGPDMALPQGELYWRYAAVDAAGNRSRWSVSRAFRISADAVIFPKPSLEDALARLPREHPRLFFRAEDVSGLRGLAEGALADRWKGVLESAGKFLKQPPDTSEPPRYPPGIEVKGDEWKRIWWGNRLRVIAVADAAATLGFAYRVSGEEKYARAARDLIMAMTQWDTNGSTEYQYNDEAAMPALYLPSRAYTWAYPAFSDEDRQAVAAMMRERGRQCFAHLTGRNHLWNPYASHSNRAWHKLGELAIAFYDEIPEAPEWLEFALTVFYTCYPVWGDADGGWHEGTAYWASYMGRFMQWAAVMRSAFGLDVFERPFFQRTGYYAMYVMPPMTYDGGFGDQAQRVSSRNLGGVVAALASGARNGYWQWYAETSGADLGAGYLGFLFSARAQGVTPQPPVDLPTSACFRGVGIAALNTDIVDASRNVQILFKSSPMGRQSHGYNANNAFHINMGGRPVLTRTGDRDIHGSPHHTQWMWDSRSDNTVLVNGQSQITHAPHATGRISVFQTTKNVDIAVGEAAESFENLERWTRRLIFLKPHALVIHDILEAPGPSTFQYVLHAPGRFDMAEGEATYARAEGSARVRFLHPAGLAISQKNGYEPPPAPWSDITLDEWHLTAETREKTAHQEFVTLITFNGAAVEAALQGGDSAYELDVTLPGGQAQLSLRKDDFSVRGLGTELYFTDN